MEDSLEKKKIQGQQFRDVRRGVNDRSKIRRPVDDRDAGKRKFLVQSVRGIPFFLTTTLDTLGIGCVSPFMLGNKTFHEPASILGTSDEKTEANEREDKNNGKMKRKRKEK